MQPSTVNFTFSSAAAAADARWVAAMWRRRAAAGIAEEAIDVYQI
jgi:hypothetical protein